MGPAVNPARFLKTAEGVEVAKERSGETLGTEKNGIISALPKKAGPPGMHGFSLAARDGVASLRAAPILERSALGKVTAGQKSAGGRLPKITLGPVQTKSSFGTICRIPFSDKYWYV